MAIVGLDGKPVGESNKAFRIGDFEIGSPKPAEFFLGHALQVAREALKGSNPLAAIQVSNPFQMEPAAQAVFMLAAEALTDMAERVKALEAQVEDLKDEQTDGPSS